MSVNVLSAGQSNVEDSIDSSSSSPDNNAIKPALLLSQSAELYYKQLLAANVAVLGKTGHLTDDQRTNLLYGKNAFDEVLFRLL